jgi:tRNA threonylcarbamoyladenosine biosynthesis protein TsaE
MTSPQFTFAATSEADTERLGQALADVLVEGGTVGLSGPLGAGKTRLVQAVAAALGADRREVVSPTFVLVHEYRAARPIYHIDAYRLRDDDEFLELGALEYFVPPNLVFVEWAPRVARCLPEDRIEITIAALAGSERRFDLVGLGPIARAQIARLRDALKGAC